MKKDKSFVYRKDMDTQKKRDLKYQVKADGTILLREDINLELINIQDRMKEDMRFISSQLQEGIEPEMNIIDCRNFWIESGIEHLREHGIQARDSDIIVGAMINEVFNHEFASIQGN